MRGSWAYLFGLRFRSHPIGVMKIPRTITRGTAKAAVSKWIAHEYPTVEHNDPAFEWVYEVPIAALSVSVALPIARDFVVVQVNIRLSPEHAIAYQGLDEDERAAFDRAMGTAIGASNAHWQMGSAPGAPIVLMVGRQVYLDDMTRQALMDEILRVCHAGRAVIAVAQSWFSSHATGVTR